MDEQLHDELGLPHDPLAQVHLKVQSSHARILLCFIGGTLMWALYFMFVYALTSLTCFWGWFATPNGGSGLKVTQVIATVIAASVIAYFSFLAFREGQKSGAEGTAVEDETIDARDPMLAFVTLLVNALYLLIIGVSLVPIFVLPVCMR